jgi:hypothetical protein
MVELTIIGPDRRLERTGRKRPEKTSPLAADPLKLDVKPDDTLCLPGHVKETVCMCLSTLKKRAWKSFTA